MKLLKPKEGSLGNTSREDISYGNGPSCGSSFKYLGSVQLVNACLMAGQSLCAGSTNADCISMSREEAIMLLAAARFEIMQAEGSDEATTSRQRKDALIEALNTYDLEPAPQSLLFLKV